MYLFLGIFLAFIFINPQVAHAWAPGTHLCIAEELFHNINLLPSYIATLMLNFRYDFLYGMIGADVIIGKSLAPYHDHCHNWKFAFEMLKASKKESQKAFSYGYIAHLASDVVAHNIFIPHMLVKGSSIRGSTHITWEYWADLFIGSNLIRSAREIQKNYDAKDDELMEKILKSVIFSFKTNRKIFSGLLLIQHAESYIRRKNVPEMVREILDEGTGGVHKHIELSVYLIGEVFGSGQKSWLVEIDPTGRNVLHVARVLKRTKRALEKKVETSDEDFIQLLRKYLPEKLKTSLHENWAGRSLESAGKV